MKLITHYINYPEELISGDSDPEFVHENLEIMLENAFEDSLIYQERGYVLARMTSKEFTDKGFKLNLELRAKIFLHAEHYPEKFDWSRHWSGVKFSGSWVDGINQYSRGAIMLDPDLVERVAKYAEAGEIDDALFAILEREAIGDLIMKNHRESLKRIQDKNQNISKDKSNE